MEKISKEELMKKLNLTEEELEKVAGGENISCEEFCWQQTKELSLACDRGIEYGASKEWIDECNEYATRMGFKCYDSCNA